MRESFNNTVEANRIQFVAMPKTKRGDRFGAFAIKRKGVELFVIICEADALQKGQEWDHVSVSTKSRTPTWEEMCFIKDLFFDEEECVIQFHPPKSNYVNTHPHCLHLWRPVGVDVPMPNTELV